MVIKFRAGNRMRGQLNDKNSFTSVVSGTVFEDEANENEYAFNGTVWKLRKGKFASGDTKPTSAETNAIIIETDTKKTFDFNGSAWVERITGVGSTVELSEMATGTAGKLLGYNASTGVLEEQDAPSSGEFGTINSSTTTTPTAQTGIIQTSIDMTEVGGGTLQVKVDGSTTDTLSNASGVYNRIITPSTSLSFVSSGGDVSGISSVAESDAEYFAVIARTYGFHWGDNGTKLLRGGNDRIYHRPITLNDQTPYSLTDLKAGYSQLETAGITSSRALYWKDDGMGYWSGSPSGVVREYTTSTAWDTDPMSAGDTYDTSSEENTDIWGLGADTTGTKLYTHGTSGTIYQHTLSTPWDLSSASYSSKSYTTGQTSGNMKGFCISRDGTILITSDTPLAGVDTTLYQYTMSTAWDISTCSLTASKDISSFGSSYPQSLLILGDSDQYLYTMDYRAPQGSRTMRMYDVGFLFSGEANYALSGGN